MKKFFLVIFVFIICDLSAQMSLSLPHLNIEGKDEMSKLFKDKVNQSTVFLLDSMLIQSNSLNNGWQNVEKYGYTYNSNKLLQSETWQTINLSTGLRSYERKTECFYDDNNNMVRTVSYDYNSTFKNWTYLGETNYTYNVAGKVTNELISMFNSTNKSILNTWKYVSLYDNENNLISQISCQWDDLKTVWVNKYRENYFYLNNGLVERNDFTWNITTNEWIKDKALWEYKYDTLGHCISFILKDSTMSISTQRREYIYDGNKLIKETYENWNKYNYLTDSYEVTYEYNEFDSLVLETYFNDKMGDGWSRINKYEYSYDENHNKKSKTQYYWYQNYWSLQGRELYYYTGDASNIQSNVQQNEIVVYLNSFNKYMVVKNINEPFNIVLYNSNGICVFSDISSNENVFDVSNIKSGFYIYKIVCRNKTYSGKIAFNQFI